MKFTAIASAVAFLISLAPSVSALQPGDEAPPLNVATWVKNGPVSLADGKGEKVYIIEFWATWCPPCRMSIPHLSAIQKKYASKGLVVVGVSREALNTVKKFVNSQKDMDYNVAVDHNGATYAAYMKDEQGIPTAFIVGKNGKILWKGHPLECDAVIEKVINGNFDAETQKKITELSTKLQQAVQSQDLQKATTLAREILELDPENQMAMRIALYGFQNNPDKTLEFLSGLIDRHPDASAPYIMELRLLNAKRDAKELRRVIERYVDNFQDDPGKLNTMAWLILDSVSFGIQPLDIALNTAKKAVALSSKKCAPPLQAAYLDTLARCYYAVGRIDLALKTEKRALNLVADAKDRKRLTTSLEFYEKTMKIGAAQ